MGLGEHLGLVVGAEQVEDVGRHEPVEIAVRHGEPGRAVREPHLRPVPPGLQPSRRQADHRLAEIQTDVAGIAR